MDSPPLVDSTPLRTILADLLLNTLACLAVLASVPLAWRCLNAWLHRQAAAAERRMASLASQQGQSALCAAPQLGSCASSGRLGAPRERPALWATSHRLGCSSEPPMFPGFVQAVYTALSSSTRATPPSASGRTLTHMPCQAVYTLFDPSAEGDLSNNVAAGGVGTDGGGARRDVDAEERGKFGFAEPQRLPNGGMLIHPCAVGATCVLYIPGFVCHAGLEPRTRRQGPRQVLFCYSHVRASPWTGPLLRPLPVRRALPSAAGRGAVRPRPANPNPSPNP